MLCGRLAGDMLQYVYEEKKKLETMKNQIGMLAHYLEELERLADIEDNITKFKEHSDRVKYTDHYQYVLSKVHFLRKELLLDETSRH